MSVPRGDRGENKLEVLKVARDLKKYTNILIYNKKIFKAQNTTYGDNEEAENANNNNKGKNNKPKYRYYNTVNYHLYVQYFIYQVRQICFKIITANTIYVKYPRDYYLRRENQYLARAAVKKLSSLIEEIYEDGIIDGRRCEHWQGLCHKVGDLITAWMKSDKENANKLFNRE